MRRPFPDYDWVVVSKFWCGRPVGRKLTYSEKAEIVRLMLRHGGSALYYADRFGMKEDALYRWIVTHRSAALESGLSDPLRFQFLPEELIPSDAILAR